MRRSTSEGLHCGEAEGNCKRRCSSCILTPCTHGLYIQVLTDGMYSYLVDCVFLYVPTRKCTVHSLPPPRSHVRASSFLPSGRSKSFFSCLTHHPFSTCRHNRIYITRSLDYWMTVSFLGTPGMCLGMPGTPPKVVLGIIGES